MNQVGIGIVGCGNISGAYFRGLQRFDGLRVAGCTDLDATLGTAAENRYGVPFVADVAELAALDDVQILVNLTPPSAHEAVIAGLVSTGRHVFTEKPLTASFATASPLVDAARAAGVTLASAPDTFLGPAGQTARAAVDDGLVGDVIGATAFVTHSKAELWHPDPRFLFTRGGGPALDMGPYHLAALVNLLGPVGSVYATARTGAATRSVTAPGRRVDTIDVTIPTHTSAVLEFGSGVVGTVMASFDVWDHELPFVELYGTRGTLSLPDPNEYDGPVRFRPHGAGSWQELQPVIAAFTEGSAPGDLPLRGPGVADLAASLSGAGLRVGAEFALHVLEVLDALALGTDGVRRDLTTTCARPEPSKETWNR